MIKDLLEQSWKGEHYFWTAIWGLQEPLWSQRHLPIRPQAKAFGFQVCPFIWQPIKLRLLGPAHNPRIQVSLVYLRHLLFSLWFHSNQESFSCSHCWQFCSPDHVPGRPRWWSSQSCPGYTATSLHPSESRRLSGTGKPSSCFPLSTCNPRPLLESPGTRESSSWFWKCGGSCAAGWLCRIYEALPLLFCNFSVYTSFYKFKALSSRAVSCA